MNQKRCVWLLALLTTLGPATVSAAPQATTANTRESHEPPTPAGLTARAGDARITLTWSASAGATDYIVYRRSAPGEAALGTATGVTALTFVDTEVTNGTTYHYSVRASNARGISAPSKETSARPEPPPPAGALATVTAAVNSGGGPISGVVAAAPAPAPTVVAGDTTPSTDALAPEGEHRAPDKKSPRAATVDASPVTSTAPGFSGISLPSTNGLQAGREMSPPPPSTPVNPTPTRGDAVSAKPQPPPPSAPNGADVVLNEASMGGATSERIVPRATGMLDPTPMAGATETARTAVDPPNGTASTDETTIRPVQARVPSATADAAAAPPAVPKDVSASAGDALVTLTWTLVPGATSYNVYRGVTPNGEVRLTGLTGPASPPYVDLGLVNGVTYYYKLTAVSDTRESLRSTEVSASPVGPPAPPDPATVAAFRFLRQATWGPRPGDVDLVKNAGAGAFLAEQLAASPSTYPDALFNMPIEAAQERFMELALTGPDQLRQRVAWALHKIWVVSAVEIPSASAIVTYHRLLLNGAFGNYRDLMRDVTLNPAMGRYLNMLNNRSQAVTGALPNENYARELMQLFTLGIPMIDQNGAPVFFLSGPAVNSYTEQDVKELARILTGWTFGDGNPATVPNNLAPENYKVPMEAVGRFHDTGAKTFLERAFPAGQTARQDLDQALDLLFNDRNLGPFIGRQLIQQLVTSNPSPAYIAAVAAAFNDNGAGVRGDLAAVVRAVLTHPEAGRSTASSGKLAEPALFVVSQLRGLNATVADHPFMSDKAEAMGQKVFYPGSVFSYFSPGYRVRGTIGGGGLPLGGPEFQILTSVTALERANFVAALVGGRFGADVMIDYTPFTSRAANAAALVDYCNLLFMGGRMSTEARLEIINAVQITRADNANERVRTALYLTLTAAQFQVDR